MLQLNGIHVPGLSPVVEQGGHRMWREVRLRFPDDGALEPVTLKVPAKPADDTPYLLGDGALVSHGAVVGVVTSVPIPPAEDEWHLKGYTFPFRGSRNPHHELRINPRITGFCPGKCGFCHRTHSHQIKPDRRMVTEPRDIVARILADEGSDALARVHRVMFIAELFGREDRFLDALESTREALLAAGYRAEREFNCCAQDVRTPDGHRRLHDLVRPSRYSYTLEFFTNRERFMGPYKGIAMERVLEILESARAAGFAEIQLNYLAGIDSLEDCIAGFSELRGRNLVDSVGLSTFTAWSDDQLCLRHPSAHGWRYYRDLAAALRDLGILVYRPLSYDMRSPFHILMDETTL